MYDFDGATYDPAQDQARLSRQYETVFDLMSDAEWRGLADIAARTDHPPASVSARLRDMRKERFGGHCVNRRRVSGGLYEYQLITKETA